jgi:hypothetical protein
MEDDMASITMTFGSKTSATALKFLASLIEDAGGELTHVELGIPSAPKNANNSAKLSFADAVSRTAFRRKDKQTLARNFDITNILYDEHTISVTA